MAILGTLNQALIDDYKSKDIKIYVNDDYMANGVSYSTGDIITIFTDSGFIRFSEVTIGTTEFIYLSSLNRGIIEIKLTGETPFNLNIVVSKTTSTISQKKISKVNLNKLHSKNCYLVVDGERFYNLGYTYDGALLKIVADDGYVITSSRTFVGNGHAFNKSHTIAANGSYSEWVDDKGIGVTYVEVTTVASDTPPPKPDMLVTQADLDSFTSQKGQLRSGSTILKVGDKYVKGSTITYFTNEKYYIVDSINLLDGGKEFNRIQTTNNFATTYPHEYSDKGLLINVVGHYQEFFVDQTEIDDINAQNSKLYVNGVLATNTTKLNVGDEIKVVANNGYKYFVNDGVSSVYSSNANAWLDLTDDETTAKFTINRIDYPLGFGIETVVVKPDVIKGVNNVYKLTYEQTKQIIRMDLIDDTIPLEPKPIGNLLLGLLELPFEIPSDMIIGKQNVNLGGFPIDINADVLADDKLTIDFGNIIVPNVKNNLLDFKNVTTVLNMPYVEKMFLETSDVIGQTINVQMVINLYDSMATVNVSSSKNSKIILSKSVDLKLSIPFGDVPSYPKGSNPHDVSLAKDNGVKTAFIEVIRNDVLNENGLFTIPVIDENLLYSQNGYIEIEKIDLKSNASKNEKDDIINLLNRGVIIK